MSTQLKIPPKIHVGYQNRKDTYTGKLAYVVYTDEKGILRKEKSWKQWSDGALGYKDFDNVPTSGFVLNKKVGDYSWGEGRKAWVRIYDPRGFEFEISVENLLFILQECSSIKGKGLEGDFVYSWDRQDLVLLPVSSVDYQEAKEFTSIQSMKLKASDLVEGYIYETKYQGKLMYLGRHPIHEYKGYCNYHRYDNLKLGHVKTVKKHVFKVIEIDKNKSYYGDPPVYAFETGASKLSRAIQEQVSSDYASYYDNFKNTHYTKKCNSVKLEKHSLESFVTRGWGSFEAVVKCGNDLKLIRYETTGYYMSPAYSLRECSRIENNDGGITLVPSSYKDRMTKEEVQALEVYYLYLTSDSDKVRII